LSISTDRFVYYFYHSSRVVLADSHPLASHKGKAQSNTNTARETAA
jgi:hypothetical protein